MTQVITSQQWKPMKLPKCEIYAQMQWTFGIQAILDAMNQLLRHLIRNINTETHLVLVGHRNSLWNTRKQLKYMELLSNNTQNANTVPVYAVEAT